MTRQQILNTALAYAKEQARVCMIHAKGFAELEFYYAVDGRRNKAHEKRVKRILCLRTAQHFTQRGRELADRMCG